MGTVLDIQSSDLQSPAQPLLLPFVSTQASFHPSLLADVCAVHPATFEAHHVLQGQGSQGLAKLLLPGT